MKPAFDISFKWKFVIPLVFVVITAVSCKRQNPQPHQVERVYNATHSIPWNCPECNPGSGLNVQCGTSVPFNKSIECVQCKPTITYSDTHDTSTCKICRKCKKHEKKIGYCSIEEDTTNCSGTCEKGYYWENNTCHPCSDCCGRNISEYHEKQCENSALPITQKCQKTICEHPTNTGHQDHLHEEGAKNGFSLVPVYTCIPLAAIMIAIFSVLAWMTRKFGWKETKAKVKLFFHSICCSSLSVRDSEADVDTCDHFQGSTANTFTWKEIEINVEEATDKMESLNSVPFSDKRPCLQRLLSAPAEVHYKDNQASGVPKFIRSVSHPGCVTEKRVIKEQEHEIHPVPVMKCSDNRRVKRVGKKKYVSVPDQCQESTKSLDPGKDGTQLERDRNHKRLNSSSFLPFKTDQCTSTTGLHCFSSDNIESVPTDFQKKLLSWRLSKIPIMPFYRNICNKLNQRRECFWDDYRLLGEKIGLDKDEVSVLGQERNPTLSMIQKFDSKEGSCIGMFQEIMEEMERDDVVAIIKEWIVYEWKISCKSSSIA
ncbi:uncharacterized protein [Montipora foliosa]|uniref:uncharacterized protein isoform X3 n=1 Tax=Montipora foliosa TaxID=591990 RepID=UPI0035F173D5